MSKYAEDIAKWNRYSTYFFIFTFGIVVGVWTAPNEREKLLDSAIAKMPASCQDFVKNEFDSSNARNDNGQSRIHRYD